MNKDLENRELENIDSERIGLVTKPGNKNDKKSI